MSPGGSKWHWCHPSALTAATGRTPPTAHRRTAPAQLASPRLVFYKACHTRSDRADQWSWHATDPPCRAATEDDSWCEALRGRSLLFVGDSLSLQMFWSLLHLVPADGGELGRARRLYVMDFKRGGEFACAMARRALRLFATTGSWKISGIAPATSTRPTT